MTWLEHRVPPPVIGLLAAAAMWGVDRLVPSLRFPYAGHVAVAAVIGIVGLAVDIAGILQFRKLRTTVNPLRPGKASALVTGGILHWTRNPMYLGMAVMLLGWAAYLSNPLSLLGIPCFVAYLDRFQIAPEERALQARFGAAFLAYRERVRRWL